MKINSNYISSAGPVIIHLNGMDYPVDYNSFFSAMTSLTGGNGVDDKKLKMVSRRNSFLKFWEQYGKKNKKEETWKLWLKLKEDEIVKIFETLPAFIKINNNPQYRPLPPTYLRGKRWEDEIEEVKKKNPLPEFAVPNTFGR